MKHGTTIIEGELNLITIIDLCAVCFLLDVCQRYRLYNVWAINSHSKVCSIAIVHQRNKINVFSQTNIKTADHLIKKSRFNFYSYLLIWYSIWDISTLIYLMKLICWHIPFRFPLYCGFVFFFQLYQIKRT